MRPRILRFPVTRLLFALSWLGCAAAPARYESAHVSPEEPQPYRGVSVEAPQETLAGLQVCVDRHAPRLPSEMYAILFDIQANSNGQIATVKIKDSMLNGVDIEGCLTEVLQRMVLPPAATRRNVSVQSRSMAGVVQAAAAPISLLPIALVAGGVTILVGVTIYVATEAVDAASESLRCREVKEKCIDHCSGPAGLPAPGGGDSGDACENAWKRKDVHSRSMVMKLGTLTAATAVRDAGIEAMDALNALVVEIGTTLPEADSKALRLAVARAMDSILDNLVNPALREYPSLDVDESTWGDIAATRARARLSAGAAMDSSCK